MLEWSVLRDITKDEKVLVPNIMKKSDWCTKYIEFFPVGDMVLLESNTLKMVRFRTRKPMLYQTPTKSFL